MKTSTAATVGTIARLAGVTVRTLHHYDDIGLVVPSERSEAGYRLYTPRDVERLQEVLFFRELGFGLDEIKDIVSAPSYRRPEALARQRRLLEAQAERLYVMIKAIDATIDADKAGITMSNEEMLDIFGDFDPAEYEQEARERWGDSEAFQQSVRRTASYARADWEQLGRENDTINAGLLALMRAGTPADSAAAMDLAEQHRAHITKWFYDCTLEIHAGLGRMYVEDERFRENIDKAGAGLAQYLSDAIAANATRLG